MSRLFEIRMVILVFLIAAFGSAGCGSGSGVQLTEVRGKVTFNGEPIESGQITFTPTAGTSSGAAAGEIKNGEYSIPASEGPMVGTHSVSIRASRKTGKQVPAAMPAPEGTMIDVTEEYIPYNYNFQTELKAELTAGENTKDFALVGEDKAGGK